MEEVGEKPYEMAGEISKACIALFPHYSHRKIDHGVGVFAWLGQMK